MPTLKSFCFENKLRIVWLLSSTLQQHQLYFLLCDICISYLRYASVLFWTPANFGSWVNIWKKIWLWNKITKYYKINIEGYTQGGALPTPIWDVWNWRKTANIDISLFYIEILLSQSLNTFTQTILISTSGKYQAIVVELDSINTHSTAPEHLPPSFTAGVPPPKGTLSVKSHTN